MVEKTGPACRAQNSVHFCKFKVLWIQLVTS
jgi:hypothetical protein